MAVFDADQYTEVQNKLVEDVTFSSGLWTVAEVQALFNQWQNRFNRDTKLMLANLDIPVLAATVQVNLPQDWIATQRAAWNASVVAGPPGPFTPVDRTSRFAALMGTPGSDGVPVVPLGMDDTSGGTLTAELFPVPVADGILQLLYACTLDPMFTDPTMVAQDIFNIPDDFVPYVCYGVMATLLGKEGRGRDLGRAKYCMDRYEEGVALAAILLGGFL